MASVISMKALLESGVHFGHRTNKWNPHMRPYIFTERNGIHIIDLQQTVKSFNTRLYRIARLCCRGRNSLICWYQASSTRNRYAKKPSAVECPM